MRMRTPGCNGCYYLQYEDVRALNKLGLLVCYRSSSKDGGSSLEGFYLATAIKEHPRASGDGTYAFNNGPSIEDDVENISGPYKSLADAREDSYVYRLALVNQKMGA